MNIKELTKEQKTELKQRYYDEKLQEKENRTMSYYEMSIIDDLVSDEEIENEYGYISFVNDDFFTNDRKESDLNGMVIEAKQDFQ